LSGYETGVTVSASPGSASLQETVPVTVPAGKKLPPDAGSAGNVDAEKSEHTGGVSTTSIVAVATADFLPSASVAWNVKLSVPTKWLLAVYLNVPSALSVSVPCVKADTGATVTTSPGSGSVQSTDARKLPPGSTVP
jgi:hypothetical protein